MTTVLYADVLFIINFSMDIISLWITAKLLSIRQKTVRFVIAASVGALSATALTALCVEGIAGAAAALLMSLAMTLIAYGFGTLRKVLWRSFALWGAGALTGGAVTALCSLGKRSAAVGAVGEASRPWGYIAVGVLIVWAFVRLLRPKLGQKTAAVCITVCGVSARTDALVDTGNGASDPISGDAVVFVSLPVAARLIGEENSRLVASLLPDGLPDRYRALFRAVVASGIGSSGVCGAIVPDEVTLSPDSTPRRAVVCVLDVPEDHFGGCGALLPSSLL